MQREGSDASDIFSATVAAAAWSLSALPLSAPEAGTLFRVAGILAGALTVFPALLLMFLEPKRGSADARLLLLGAVVLASIGLAHIGWAQPWQVAFGYLLPAALLIASAAALAVAGFSVQIAVKADRAS
jgi:hypothetical protein